MKPEKQGGGFTEAEANQLGIRMELFPILQKMNIQSVEQLKSLKSIEIVQRCMWVAKKTEVGTRSESHHGRS
jgi:hypothetical protein